MPTYQATLNAQDKAVFDHATDRCVHAVTYDFNIGALLASSRAAVNDIIEVCQLPPRHEIAELALKTSAAVSGAFKASIISGDPGSEHDASDNNRLSGVTDYQTAWSPDAAGTVRADVFGSFRPDALFTKTASLALVCTTASTANETARVRVVLAYYKRNEES